MWCTSRASPDSTTSATLVRDFCRTRCWCTAEVSSSDGIGARSAVECRSDSMMHPGAGGDRLVGLQPTSLDGLRPAPSAPPSTSYRPEMVAEAKPGRLPSAFIPHQLGQVVVVQHRERQHDLPAGPRAGLQQVRLRADDATTAR